MKKTKFTFKSIIPQRTRQVSTVKYIDSSSPMEDQRKIASTPFCVYENSRFLSQRDSLIDFEIIVEERGEESEIELLKDKERMKEMLLQFFYATGTLPEFEVKKMHVQLNLDKDKIGISPKIGKAKTISQFQQLIQKSTSYLQKHFPTTFVDQDPVEIEIKKLKTKIALKQHSLLTMQPNKHLTEEERLVVIKLETFTTLNRSFLEPLTLEETEIKKRQIADKFLEILTPTELLIYLSKNRTVTPTTSRQELIDAFFAECIAQSKQYIDGRINSPKGSMSLRFPLVCHYDDVSNVFFYEYTDEHGENKRMNISEQAHSLSCLKSNANPPELYLSKEALQRDPQLLAFIASSPQFAKEYEEEALVRRFKLIFNYDRPLTNSFALSFLTSNVIIFFSNYLKAKMQEPIFLANEHDLAIASIKKDEARINATRNSIRAETASFPYYVLFPYNYLKGTNFPVKTALNFGSSVCTLPTLKGHFASLFTIFTTPKELQDFEKRLHLTKEKSSTPTHTNPTSAFVTELGTFDKTLYENISLFLTEQHVENKREFLLQTHNTVVQKSCRKIYEALKRMKQIRHYEEKYEKWYRFESTKKSEFYKLHCLPCSNSEKRKEELRRQKEMCYQKIIQAQEALSSYTETIYDLFGNDNDPSIIQHANAIAYANQTIFKRTSLQLSEFKEEIISDPQRHIQLLEAQNKIASIQTVVKEEEVAKAADIRAKLIKSEVDHFERPISEIPERLLLDYSEESIVSSLSSAPEEAELYQLENVEIQDALAREFSTFSKVINAVCQNPELSAVKKSTTVHTLTVYRTNDIPDLEGEVREVFYRNPNLN